MAELYNGSSEGVKQVVDGFIDYALEVGINRAFPSIIDGLKTSQRRPIYAMDESKIYTLVKSTKAVSSGLVYHPHGDEALYKTMARMARSNGSVLPSLIEGGGDLDKSYSNSGPAAMRYTYMCLSKEARELLLRDLDGVPFKQTETDEGLEPVHLPARFPMALTASTQGMGVGIANKIPSFNYNEVIKLAMEFIKDGETFNDQIIYPDFPNGGIVVANNSELAKIMTTGRGKIRSKAKISVNKRDILVEELPYNITDGKVIEKIKDLVRLSKTRKLKDGSKNPFFGEFPYITSEDNVILTSDLKGFGIKIRCRRTSDVDTVIQELSRRGILATSFTSNMIFTHGSKLVVEGVYGVIRSWYEERKATLNNKFNKHISSLEKEKIVLDYFVKLINNEEYKKEYLRLISSVGILDASDYLRSIFEGIPSDVCDWISKRRANAFLNGGKYSSRYEEVTNTIEMYKGYLSDLPTYIYNDLEDALKTFGDSYPRKTEITYKDYKYVRKEDVVEEDTSYCGYVLYNDGYLQKVSSVEGFAELDNVVTVIEGKANSILVGFDCVGNLIRVYGTELNYGKTYLHDYLGVSGIMEGYHIMYLTLVDGSRKRLLYSDGKMSVLDTSEFIGKKQRKRIILNGVPQDVEDTLVEVLDEDSMEEYLYVADESKGLSLGVIRWADLPVKSRLAKTRAFSGSKSMKITQWGTCSTPLVHRYFNILSDFEGRLRKVKSGDVNFDGSEFTKGGFV